MLLLDSGLTGLNSSVSTKRLSSVPSYFRQDTRAGGLAEAEQVMLIEPLFSSRTSDDWRITVAFGLSGEETGGQCYNYENIPLSPKMFTILTQNTAIHAQN
jgi:hypothetical protein